MGSWFMGYQWLTLSRASNFLVKGLDRSRYVANLRKLTTLLKLTRLFVYNLREQGGGSATLQSVGRGCKRQSISLQDVAALQERNHQTIEKWDVQFGRTEQNRYDISLLFFLRHRYKLIRKESRQEYQYVFISPHALAFHFLPRLLSYCRDLNFKVGVSYALEKYNVYLECTFK